MSGFTLLPAGSPASVPGFAVGHAQLPELPCGVSVVLCPQGAVGGVDVRGSAAGTRQMDALHPGHVVERVHGLCLAGGSSFGLAAAQGVQAFLEEAGAGFPAGAYCIPIVPAAVIFDLGLTGGRGRPDPELGRAACRAAGPDPMARGSVGAGAGATVGKLFGLARAMKGGVGGAAARVGELRVGALAVVNAFGDIRDEGDHLIAGARAAPDSGELMDTAAWFLAGGRREGFAAAPPQNTTLAVVACNAGLTKPQACKVAALAHHGLVKAIEPVHTTMDGDLVICLAAGQVAADVNGLGVMAARLVRLAILDAVRAAAGLPGLPAARDLPYHAAH